MTSSAIDEVTELFAKSLSLEVQAHGFSWEKDILQNVYNITQDELKSIKYTSKMDLPAHLNRLDHCNVSIKTTCNANSVCMADCLRVFDAVDNNIPIHLIVIEYQQNDLTNTKHIKHIIEIDLTSSRELLFGNLTRQDLEELDTAVKNVPQKRKPTSDEYEYMYAIRNRLLKQSGALHLDIKCNSTQSRLQCSFNRFQEFVSKNPNRIVARSNHTSPNEFKGGVIKSAIKSARRVFKIKPPL